MKSGCGSDCVDSVNVSVLHCDVSISTEREEGAEGLGMMMLEVMEERKREWWLVQ